MYHQNLNSYSNSNFSIEYCLRNVCAFLKVSCSSKWKPDLPFNVGRQIAYFHTYIQDAILNKKLSLLLVI